ncbi:MAG: hypothetical protein EP330_03180 [Deltaproteobacteria bacterium]|nr:MAG: hypothetical protein EP330_03180 [Deltaproteobacteria bacterium]
MIPRNLVITNNYTTSGGIAEVRRAALALSSGTSTTVSLTLSAVTVSTPGTNAMRSAWVQDADGAAEIALAIDGAITFAPGQRISGTVTRVTNDNGHPVISGLTATVASTDNFVSVPEVTGTALDASYDSEMVHAYGQITQVVGACGSVQCYQLTHGGQTLGLRAPSSVTYSLGDCVDLYAPPSTIGSQVAFEILNPGWSTVYGTAR